MLYHFQVRVLEEIFAKPDQPRLIRRNQRFLLMLKEKISVKGHFIDDSNEYKFIYVPSSSSNEKNYIFDERWVLNFPFAKVCAGLTEALIPRDKLL